MPEAGHLLIEGLRAEGRHGVLPQEKLNFQPFEIDVDIETDLSEAARSDVLGDTIDYALVASEVASIVREKSYALLERLAYEIASRVLDFNRVERVTVTVRKLEPPMGAAVSGVAARIVRSR